MSEELAAPVKISGNGRVFVELQGDIIQGGKVVVRDERNNDAVTIANGRLTLGTEQQVGVLTLTDASGKITARIRGNDGSLEIRDEERVVIGLDAGDGSKPVCTIGADGAGGELRIVDSQGRQAVRLTGGGSVLAGSDGRPGKIVVEDSKARERVRISGEASASQATVVVKDDEGRETLRLFSFGSVVAGAQGEDGSFVALDNQGRDRVHVGGKGAEVRIKDHSGHEVLVLSGAGDTARVTAGGHGMGGHMLLFPGAAGTSDAAAAEAHINADSGNMRLGGGANQATGQIFLRNGEGRTRVFLDGGTGEITLRDGGGKGTVSLDGQAGDIVLHNADCAEDFEIADDVTSSAGDVMVVGPDGKLRPCTKANDRTVVGVVAGGGDLKPGIVLGRRQTSTRAQPIALIGRVNCNVDATTHPISPGDLLTTSSTTGRAMTVTGGVTERGSVIGKALAGLSGGTGMIPIFVALQ